MSALADDTDLLIEKTLKASGVVAQIEQLNQGILSAIPDDAFPDKKRRAEAAAFLKEDANKGVLLSTVQAALRASLDRDTLDKIASFWDSKVGKKACRAQQSALDTSMLKRVREGRSLVPSLDDRRRALLQRIVTAQQTAQGNERLLNSVIRGLADGSSAETTQETQLEEIKRKIGLIEKEIHTDRQSTDDIALISCAHLFRSFDDKELEELASFEESEPASRFRDALLRGLDQAVYRCAKALGRYSVKPRPAAPEKDEPQRVPARRPTEKDRDTDDFMNWEIGNL